MLIDVKMLIDVNRCQSMLIDVNRYYGAFLQSLLSTSTVGHSSFHESQLMTKGLPAADNPRRLLFVNSTCRRCSLVFSG